jgi:hypothetical protein
VMDLSGPGARHRALGRRGPRFPGTHQRGAACDCRTRTTGRSSPVSTPTTQMRRRPR